MDSKPVVRCVCKIDCHEPPEDVEMWDGFNCPRTDDPTRQDIHKALRMWWPQESCRCGSTGWVCLMCHGAGHIVDSSQGYKVTPCPRCTTMSADGIVNRRYLRVEAKQAEYAYDAERVYADAL